MAIKRHDSPSVEPFRLGSSLAAILAETSCDSKMRSIAIQLEYFQKIHGFLSARSGAGLSSLDLTTIYLFC